MNINQIKTAKAQGQEIFDAANNQMVRVIDFDESNFSLVNRRKHYSIMVVAISNPDESYYIDDTQLRSKAA